MQESLVTGCGLLSVVALAAGSVASVGCVDKGKKNQVQKDPAFIKANLLATAPAKMTNTINASLNDQIIYLGNDVSSKVLKPGDAVTIVHYWQVKQAPGKRWRVFSHVNGSTSQDWMNVDPSKMRLQYPPHEWKDGDIIRDEHKFKLKKDWSSPVATVSVGLFSGNAVKDRMAITKGPKDKQNRIPVVRFKVAVTGSAGDIKKNVLKKAPKIGNKLNVNFGGKVVYLGNDAPEKVSPGQAISIIHYWKIISPPGADWQIKSRLEGTAPTDKMNVDSTAMRRAYGAKKWKAGDIIRDTQKIVLRRNWASKAVKLRLAMVDRKTKQNIAITTGPKDDQNWSDVATVTVKFNVIPKAKGPIKIDGIADEESWKTALASPNFVDAEGGKQTQMTKAKMLWDDEALYVFVEVSDTDINSPFKKRDDPLWKGDVVELFIDADRNGRGYVELQVNPNNVIFDSWFPRGARQSPQFGWNSKMETKVVVNGTVNKKDSDKGWNVEIKIPHETVKGANPKMRVSTPPKVGNRWRLNVIRQDRVGNNYQGTSSWSQITIKDYHALRLMMEVVFGDDKGEFAPPAPPPTTPPTTPDGKKVDGKKVKGHKVLPPGPANRGMKRGMGLRRRLKMPGKRVPVPTKKTAP